MEDSPRLPARRPRRLPAQKGEELIVRYRPMAEFEKWISQRVDDRSALKTAWVATTVVVFLLFGAPVLLFLLYALVKFLAAQGMGAVSAEAYRQMVSSNIQVLLYMFGSLAAVSTVATVYYQSLPTHLSISRAGMRLLWRHRLNKKDGELIPWEKVSHIDLRLPPGKTSPLDHVVRFHHDVGKSLNLRLGAVPSSEERANILNAVENWAPNLERDAEVVEALELPPDHSYTELWLQALSGPPKRERLKPLEQGAVLKDSRYSVRGALGVGGQGTAYVAVDHHFDGDGDGETIVLKEFILPVFVDVNVRKQSLERFEKEARILKQLDHDQVVKLIDFFVEDHRGYLVLEHIDGMSLREKVLKEGAQSEATVRGLALQMCSILKYLHSLTPPVVHRDFTPDNLILRKDGTLKLVDFNVAQQTESTATGTVVGKHAYLPPEQFRGQPTSQSDIYSMGASLFFLLTAQEPEPITQLFPRQLIQELSESIEKIVARATEIELNDRYACASEIEADLASAPVS